VTILKTIIYKYVKSSLSKWQGCWLQVSDDHDPY